MKSIGLYGDSFAGSITELSYKYHWSSYLSLEFNCPVKNYGKPGSSIYYSYDIFKQTHIENTINIFLITDPNRYIGEVQFAGTKHFIPSLYALEHIYKDKLNKLDEDDYKDLRGWFVSSKEKFNLDMAELMLEDIKRLDNDVIFLSSGFVNNTSEEIFNLFGLPKFNLLDIQNYMFLQFGVKNFEFHNYLPGENRELISGHFTPEINQILAKMFIKRIKEKVWDWVLPEKINFQYPKEMYWKT